MSLSIMDDSMHSVDSMSNMSLPFNFNNNNDSNGNNSSNDNDLLLQTQEIQAPAPASPLRSVSRNDSYHSMNSSSISHSRPQVLSLSMSSTSVLDEKVLSETNPAGLPYFYFYFIFFFF